MDPLPLNPPPDYRAPQDRRPDSKEEAEHKEKQRQLRMTYASVFATPNGQIILADLKQRYGFAPDDTELPIFIPGLDAATVSHRDGMREPIRHILRQKAPLPEKTNPKPTTATS